MRFTFKLVGSFVLAVVAVAIVHGYFEVQTEARRFSKETGDDARHIYDRLYQSVEAAWTRGGRTDVVDLIQKENEIQRRTRIRWVSFGARAGSSDCPSAPADRLNAVVIAKHESIRAKGGAGSAFLHTYWSVPAKSLHGGLEISRPTDELDRKTQTVIVRKITQLSLTVLLVALVAALVGVRYVGRPLKQLTEKTRRIGAGDLTGPVRVRSRDELGELATSINQMCTQLLDAQQRIQEETSSRVAAVEQLRHADRLRTVGRLGAGIAHQLGTPLNVVSGQAEMIAAGELSDGEVKTGAKMIYSEAERMTSTIRQLLDFARPSTPQRTAADIAQVVRETASLLDAVAKKSNVELSLDVPEGTLQACIDVGQTQQALANLIVNAIQAMPEGGKVQIELKKHNPVAPNGPAQGRRAFVRLQVKDEGVGIAEEDLDQVFEPFFTTKDVGEGTGLGLSIAYGIIREQSGWIDVVSQPGHGTCFTVYLPEESDL